MRGGLNQKQLKDSKVFYNFILHFFRIQGILYTKIGIDELDDLMNQTFKLLNDYFSIIDKESNKSNEIGKLIHLSFIMIFIAHATITDGTKDVVKKAEKSGQALSQKDILGKVLKANLPNFAIRQIGEFLLCILDRITSIPSPWLEAITPLVTWLTLHKQDNLVKNLFQSEEQLQIQLSRIHLMISNFCNFEMKKIKSEAEQTQLIEMMSNNLLSEESFFVGFLPLQSYIDTKKQIQNGAKCPQDKENLVRCLILRDHLEFLNCTREDLKNSGSNSANSDEEEKSSGLQNSGNKQEDIFSKIDELHQESFKKPSEKPQIVVDGSNVAMRHGKNQVFSVKGLQIVLEYWQKNGHKVVCFLPDYLFDYNQVNQKKKLAQMNIKEAKAAQLPDNVSLLHKLEEKGLIVRTPPQDYDDSYGIRYAKDKNAFIVTNDKFRDFVQKQEEAMRKKERKWILEHSISYTFHGNEFMPNPDSKIYEDFPIEGYKNYPLEDL